MGTSACACGQDTGSTPPETTRESGYGASRSYMGPRDRTEESLGSRGAAPHPGCGAGLVRYSGDGRAGAHLDAALLCGGKRGGRVTRWPPQSLAQGREGAPRDSAALHLPPGKIGTTNEVRCCLYPTAPVLVVAASPQAEEGPPRGGEEGPRGPELTSALGQVQDDAHVHRQGLDGSVEFLHDLVVDLQGPGCGGNGSVLGLRARGPKDPARGASTERT